jgi:hypothetical protein
VVDIGNEAGMSDAKQEQTDIPRRSGFPFPPEEAGPAQTSWRDKLDHWKAEMEFRRLVLDENRQQTEEHKLALEMHRADQIAHVESSKAAFDYAKTAISQAFLANGGAAIALLAQLSAAGRADGTSRLAASSLAMPLQCLAAGIFFACLTGAASYVAQIAFTHRRNVLGQFIRGVALISWVLSIGAFVWAVWIAAKALV